MQGGIRVVITNTDYGSIIFGTVDHVKPGVGSAKDDLSIITMNCIDQFGKFTGQQEKILCWDNELPLATKARKLHAGETIICRVKYDIGDPLKSTCYEMKKQGVFNVKYRGNPGHIIAGRVAKIYRGNKVTGLWIPTYKPCSQGFETKWYYICFWENQRFAVSQNVSAGNFVICRCSKLKNRSYNDREYIEASADKCIFL